METFIVRVWHPVDAPEPVSADSYPLRGVVEHVGRGPSHRFHAGGELLDVLRAALSSEGAVSNIDDLDDPPP